MTRIAFIAIAAALIEGCASTLYGVGTIDDALSSIDTSNGATTRIGPLDPAAPGPGASQGRFATPAAMSLRSHDNALFVWNNTGVPSGVTDRVLALVDRCTGRAAEVAQTSSPPQNAITALAFSPDGRLFGFGRQTTSGPVYLYEVDPANVSQRVIAPVTGITWASTGQTDVVGAEFNSAGVLYAVEHFRLALAPGGTYLNRLIIVNPATAAATVVGVFDRDVGTPGSIAFTSTGTLVGSGSGGPSGNVIYEIAPASAAITNFRSLSANPMHGLAFGAPRDDCAGVPAMPWRSVTSTVNHVCALATDGRAFCWGENINGKLGDASATNRNVPTEVRGPLAAVPGLAYQRLSAGGSHTCGITAAGAAYCWGSNGSGELGTGASGWGLPYPASVAAPEPFSEIVSGGSHTCALSLAGKAYCWGYNQFGQVGDAGAPANALTPVAVAEPYSGAVFKLITAGQAHTCGITTTDVAYCWGWNEHGQLGDGNGGTGLRQASPVAIAGGHRFASLSAGMYHTCGVTDAGAALCWGGNRSGGLGSVSTDICSGEPCTKVPTAVSGGIQFGLVRAGANHTCGTTRSGIAYCWGTGTTGQVGSGETLPDCPYGERCTYAPRAVFGGRAYASLAAGQGATCAVDFSGVAYCWGGQTNMLGTGVTNLVSDRPIVVSNP